MTKLKPKRLLSLLLSLAMVFTLTATPVFAADTDTSGEVTVESTSDESTDSDVIVDEESDIGESEESEDESAVTAESVQAMIDALPDAEDITADNAADVESQLDAIDAARVEIGEDADYLDYTKYDAACAALEALYSTGDDSSDDADEEVDEFVPDVELPDGADRSDKIAATSVAATADDESSANVSYNSNTYSTVSEAINAVETSGTITLTGDVSEETITIPSGKTITLDLGGYTLTLTGGTTYTDTDYTGGTFRASLVNQGSLTVQNGTLQGSGTYTTDGSNYYVNNTILSTGTLKIESGATVNAKVYAVTNLGGTFITAGAITAELRDAITTYGGSVAINGGTITATNSSYYGSAVNIFNRCYDSSMKTSDAATVTMNGGTINAYCYGFSTNNLYSGYSSLTILGGKVETVAACIYWPTPGTITIGSENSTSDETPYLLNTGGSGIVICCGTLNIYSGTIEATYGATTSTPFDSTTWAANYRASSGMTGLADAISIIANRSANYAQYGLTVNLAGGTYVSASNYAVRYLNCNAASDSDSTDTSQIISVTLSGGTYTGGTTTDGESVAAIDTCEYEDTSEISTLTVTGGTYSSNVSTYTTSTSAAVATTDDEGNTVYEVVTVSEDTVALVYDTDGNYTAYTSLKAASAVLEDGCKVVLVANSYDSPFTLSSGEVTLDLNGYSINMSSSAAYPRTPVTVSGGTLKITDSSADGAGVVSAGANSSQGAVYNTGGTLVIEGGTFNVTRTYTAAVITNGENATTTINGGEFHGDRYALQVTAGSLTVNGGEFYAALGEKLSVATSSGTDEETTVGTTGNCIMVRQDGEAAAMLTITGGSFKCGTTYTTATTTNDTTGNAVITTAGSGNTAAITISGGVFSSNRLNCVKNNLANGYTIENIDSTDSRYEDGYRYEVTMSEYLLGYYDENNEFAVASGYATAKAAIAAADDTNNVVVINAESSEENPITTSISVSATYPITLDLNGSYIETTNPAISVGVGADLTIVDSQDNAVVKSSVGQAGVVRNYGGALTIEGGTYEQTSTASYVFVVYAAASVSSTDTSTASDNDTPSTTITGGTFISSTGYAFGITVGDITVSGGNVDALNNFVIKNDSTATVKGGYFVVDPTSYVAEGCAAYSIADDTYNYTVSKSGMVAMVNGSFYESLDDAIAVANAMTSADADSVTVTLLKDVFYTAKSSKPTIKAAIPYTLDLNGHSISFSGNTSHLLVDNSCTASVTITNTSEMESSITNSYAAVSAYAVNVATKSANMGDGTVTIGNVKLVSNSGIALWSNSTSNIIVDGATIITNTTNSSTDAVKIQYSTIQVKSGTISGGAGIEIYANNATAVFGTENGGSDDLQISKLKITNTGANLTIYSGTFDEIAGEITDVSKIYSTNAIIKGVDSCTLPLANYWMAHESTDANLAYIYYTIETVTEETAVAKITSADGNTETLCGDLVTAASNLQNGETLTLLADYEGTSRLYIGDAYNVTLDLAGYSIKNIGETNNYNSYGIYYDYSPGTAASGYVTNNVFTITNSAEETKASTISGYVAVYAYSQYTTNSNYDVKVVIEDGVTLETTNESTDGTAQMVHLGNEAYMDVNDTTKAWLANGGFIVTVESEERLYEILQCAVRAINDGGTITMAQDYIGTNTIGASNVTFGKDFTLDLSGHTWTYTGAGTAISNPKILIYLGENYGWTVKNGIINAAGNYISAAWLYKSSTCTANLTLDAVNINLTSENGYYYGIVTNGSTGNEHNIVLTNSTLNAPYCEYGIFFPSDGSVTLTNSTITAEKTGIEIRAGSLTVTDSNITATSTEFLTASNGSGTTVEGAGIAVSQHTTDKPITVTITDSEISGYYGVYEINYNSSNTSAVEVNISGDDTKITGNRAEAVYSVSVSGDNTTEALTNDRTTVAVSGGSYSTAVDFDYCADGYIPTEQLTDGTYSVTEFTLGISDGTTTVPGEITSGYGESVMYVKVSGDYIGTEGYYFTSAYPTTSLTYTVEESNTTDSGKYIFTGWYTLDDDGNYTTCSSNMWDSTTTKAETYYAKFVDANMLSVVCVFTPNSVTGSGNFWRLISSTSASGDSIEFVVASSDTTLSTIEEAKIKRYSSSYKLTSINATFTPAIFSGASKYVVTGSYTDSDNNYTSISVTANLITADGTKVAGQTYTFTITGSETTTTTLTMSN